LLCDGIHHRLPGHGYTRILLQADTENAADFHQDSVNNEWLINEGLTAQITHPAA
jgi:hypothetical protein